MAALAANQGTNPGLIKQLRAKNQPLIEDGPDIDPEELEWIMPQTQEEVDEMLKLIGTGLVNGNAQTHEQEHDD